MIISSRDAMGKGIVWNNTPLVSRAGSLQPGQQAAQGKPEPTLGCQAFSFHHH